MSGAQITKLQINNFRGIRSMEITPGDINLFAGMNAQGKTSVLDALAAALRGKMPPEAVRHDAERAEILVELNDGTSVHRKIPAAGTKGRQSVRVKQNRAIISSPQAYLDGLFADEGFNPVDFIRAPDRQKRLLEALPVSTTLEEVVEYLQSVGLSKGDLKGLRTESTHAFEVFEAVAKTLGDERKGVNREVKQLRGWITSESEGLDEVTDPAEEIEALLAEQARIASDIAECRATEQQISDAQAAEIKAEHEKTSAWGAVRRAQEEVESLERQLEQARRRAQEASEHHDDRTTQLGEAQSLTRKLQDENSALGSAMDNLRDREVAIGKEIGELRERRGAYEAVLRQQGAIEAKQAELEAKQTRSKLLTAGINLFSKTAPAEALARTPLPVEGLEYRDNGFYVNNVHIDQLSAAETVRVACQFTLERVRAKGLHVVCVDGLEHLDDVQRGLFFKEMADSGIQLWATEVDHGTGRGAPDGDGVLYVVMRDGAPTGVQSSVPEPADSDPSGLLFD